MAGFPKRKGAVPQHIFQGQGPVKMRKVRAATGHFPYQRIAQRVGLQCQKDQVRFACEMFGGGLGGLGGGRKVHKAVGDIDRRPGGFTFGLELGPFGRAEYLVNQHGHDMPRAGLKVKRALSLGRHSLT